MSVLNNKVDKLPLQSCLDALDSKLSAAASGDFSANSALTLPNNVLVLVGDGAPVDGTTGDDAAGPGSLYVDYTNANLYVQTSLISTPVWKLVTRAA